jgi:hypothetical protein
MVRNVFPFAALSVLLLSACGGAEPAAENATVDAEANALENQGAPQPIEPAPPANIAVDPVPPPDSVSHPEGYLPPTPGEADPGAANSSGPTSQPATEDQYIRNQGR